MRLSLLHCAFAEDIRERRRCEIADHHSVNNPLIAILGVGAQLSVDGLAYRQSEPLLDLFIVNIRSTAKLFGFFFRGGVAQEVPAADFRTRQILEQIRLTQWRMKLDVKVKARVVAAV